MNNKLNDVKLFINQMNSVNPNINYENKTKLEEIKENEKYNPNNNDNANNIINNNNNKKEENKKKKEENMEI